VRSIAATLVGLLGLAVFGALLLDDPDQSGSRTTKGEAGLPAPATVTAGGLASPSSATSSSTTVTSATPSATGSASGSSSVTPATAVTPATPVTGPRIETSESFYFGEAFETILIPGTYVGAAGPARLRVQLRQPDGWEWFPLPVVTQPSGDFRAFVEMDAGSYRLRLLDPESGVKSRVLTVLVV